MAFNIAHASDRVMHETAKISKVLPALPLSDHVRCPICIQSKCQLELHFQSIENVFLTQAQIPYKAQSH